LRAYRRFGAVATPMARLVPASRLKRGKEYPRGWPSGTCHRYRDQQEAIT
jgi:hypothetical protein